MKDNSHWFLRRKVEGRGFFQNLSLATLYQALCGIRLCRKAKPLANSGPFTKLPIEIIQRIVLYLPLQSQATLFLTNKFLLNAIGSLSWKELACDREKARRIDLLILLERDVGAKYWACRDCAILHSKAAVCWKCPASKSGLISLCNLQWGHIYLVMQRHFRGNEFGLPIQVLSKKSDPSGTYMDRYIPVKERHGKIIDDEIFIKAKLTISASMDIRLASISICHHLRSKFDCVWLGKTEFHQLISCRLTHLHSEQKSCAYCAPVLRRCKWCAIEYDLFTTKSRKGPRLEIDVWANFGSGQHRSDPKWSLPTSFNWLWVEQAPIKYELGTIRAKYELGG